MKPAFAALSCLCALAAPAASAEDASPAPVSAVQPAPATGEATPAPIAAVQPAAEPSETRPGATAAVAPVVGPSEARSGGPARASASIVVEDEPAPAEAPPAPAGEEKVAIGEAIRQKSADVEACYSKSLERNPLLMGKLIAQFDIGPRGKVIGATADGIPDRELLLCVVQVVRKWEFPSPASGGKVRVRYPWRLEPRASALPASAPLGSAK